MVIQKAAPRLSPSIPTTTETTPRLPTTRIPPAAQRTPGHSDASSFDSGPPRAGQRRYSAPEADQALRLGHGGPAVAELQQKLNALGATPPLTADGKLGPRTQAMMQRLLGSPTLDAAAQAKLQSLTAPAGSGAVEDLRGQANKLMESVTAPSNPGPNATPQQQAQFEKDTQRYGELQNLAKQTTDAAAQLPNPIPNGLVAPRMPGADATAQQAAQFQVDLMKFVAAAKGGSTSPTSATELADKAVSMMGWLTEPSTPGRDATAQQLAQYENDTQRYDQLRNLAQRVIEQTAGLPNPLPAGLVAPSMPGPDATLQQTTQFEADLMKFAELARR